MIGARRELDQVLNVAGYTWDDIEVFKVKNIQGGNSYLGKIRLHYPDSGCFRKLLLDGFILMEDGTWFDRGIENGVRIWVHRKRPELAPDEEKALLYYETTTIKPYREGKR